MWNIKTLNNRIIFFRQKFGYLIFSYSFYLKCFFYQLKIISQSVASTTLLHNRDTFIICVKRVYYRVKINSFHAIRIVCQNTIIIAEFTCFNFSYFAFEFCLFNDL